MIGQRPAYQAPLVPIGLMPRHIHEVKRMRDIEAAIDRYIAAQEPIPVEWIQEYNELINKRK